MIVKALSSHPLCKGSLTLGTGCQRCDVCIHQAFNLANKYIATQVVTNSDKTDKDALTAYQELFEHIVDRKVQHVKTGNWYLITGLAWREHDMVLTATYKTFHQEPLIFCRPVTEMIDGRFQFTKGK